MTSHNSRLVEQLAGPSRERMSTGITSIEKSNVNREAAPPTGLTRRGVPATPSFLGKQTETLLWVALGPLLFVAAAGLIAITLSWLPDGPASLAGPLSGQSLLHFPR